MTREMRVGLVASAIILSCITVLGNQRVAHAQTATTSTTTVATSGTITATSTSATTAPTAATTTVSVTVVPTVTITATSGAVPMTSSAPACGAYLTSYIRYGAANDKTQVLKLQAFLNKFEGDNVPLSGEYDQATLQAVEAFQTKYASEVLTPWGIAQPTGYVYLTTEQMINTLYCGGTATFPLTTEQQSIITRSSLAMSQTPAASGASTARAATGQVKGASTEGGANNGSANMDVMGSTSDDLSASSSPVSNPLDGIGAFLHNLFSR